MRIQPELKNDWLMFEERIAKEGIPVVQEVSAKLKEYAALLYYWSGKINLISVGDRNYLVTRHIAPSLALIPLIKMVPHQTILDFGSGAGLPGIPLKIVLADSDVILVESRRRRAHFLREVVRRLGLEKVKVFNARLEKGHFRDIEVVVSRAVKQPDEVWSSIKPFLTPYGSLITTLSQKQKALALIALERVSQVGERASTKGLVLG
ncbi:MAG: 16S rRNA (guanine(527)-N(7))-methyltransferase RsmG [Candidatus Latescibacteria bacterium]|nr:16S rRNA (guanine(527)-N(7))-methyltransferase RsmG [Candidatus Latescibacterota bacterium]